MHALLALEHEELGADMLELGTSLADCFPALEPYDIVVALDAVAAGGVPGSLYWLSREAFVRKREGLSLHECDLLDALDVAALRGKRPVLHVAGMEPGDVTEWSMELTAPVRDAFPAYLAMVRKRVRDLAQNG